MSWSVFAGLRLSEFGSISKGGFQFVASGGGESPRIHNERSRMFESLVCQQGCGVNIGGHPFRGGAGGIYERSTLEAERRMEFHQARPEQFSETRAAGLIGNPLMNRREFEHMERGGGMLSCFNIGARGMGCDPSGNIRPALAVNVAFGNNGPGVAPPSVQIALNSRNRFS